MSETWATVLLLAVATAAIRASGPVLLGGRELPGLLLRVVALLAPALLAALIVVGTFTTANGDLELDARAAGLAAGGAVLVRNRRAMLTACAVAAAAAALARAIA